MASFASASSGGGGWENKNKKQRNKTRNDPNDEHVLTDALIGTCSYPATSRLASILRASPDLDPLSCTRALWQPQLLPGPSELSARHCSGGLCTFYLSGRH